MKPAEQTARKLVNTNFPVCHSDPEFEYWLMLYELKLVRPRFYWGHGRSRSVQGGPTTQRSRSPIVQAETENQRRKLGKRKPLKKYLVQKSDGTTMEIEL